MIGDELQGHGMRMSPIGRHISGLHSSDVDQLAELVSRFRHCRE